MATVMITGGTGLIGTALSKALTARGYEVIILTRKIRQEKRSLQNISYAEWNVEGQTIDETAVQKADYLVHLAGANVAEKRWTVARKQEIIDSRVKSGDLLVHAIKKIPNKIKAAISSSAIGYYGPDPTIPNPKPFIETDTPSNDFLGTVVQQWESAIEPATQSGKRLVILRTGIVLSTEGGAYAEFKKPLRFGTATVLGNGQQIVSWIHIDDLVRLYINAIENENLHGVYNAVAPQPVSNKTLILQIAKERGKFYVTIPVPAPVLKLALGEMSVEVLKSATVSAEKIQKTGFVFQFPDIASAIRTLAAS